MDEIIGIINETLTPLFENGDVNPELIEINTKMLVKNGLKGVISNDSSGEGYFLVYDEHFISGTVVKDSNNLVCHDSEIGSFCIGAIASPYSKVDSIDYLVKCRAEIACVAPQLPIYFYHIPALCGVLLTMLPFLEAVDGRIQNFGGIKYTTKTS